MTEGSQQDDTALRVRVSRVRDEAQGIRSFEMRALNGGDLPAFTPGSHIRVRTPAAVVRKYSLCGAPAERDRYLIAVKREDGGQGGSRSMHDHVHEGEELSVSLPENAFPMQEDAKAYLFIAGGIGITPILAMIRSLDELAPPWKLVYLSRSAQTSAFLDVLADPAWQGRVTVHHDEGQPDREFDLWTLLEKPNTAQVYCCGPRGLMEGVRDMTGHWSPANVHFESFLEGGGVRADDKPFTVRLARSGEAYEVPVGCSILQVLREHGHEVPASCESGTCGTCRTGLLQGQADHRDMVLLPEEEERQIMVCVSRAKSAELELDL